MGLIWEELMDKLLDVMVLFNDKIGEGSNFTTPSILIRKPFSYCLHGVSIHSRLHADNELQRESCYLWRWVVSVPCGDAMLNMIWNKKYIN